jgi:PAS domain S-box-containing protein
MPTAIRILIVEDVASDVELLTRELSRALEAHTTLVVDTEAELVRALHEFAPQVVLSDHFLPGFDGNDVLRIVKHERPRTPVVIVTGTLGDEMAADYINAGAADFVLKDRLQRLGPAVRRALMVQRALQDAASAEAALVRSERRFRKLAEHGNAVITLLDAAGLITYSTPTVTAALGYAPWENVGVAVLDLIHPEDARTAGPLFKEVLAYPGRVARGDFRVRHRDDSWRDLEVVAVNRLEDPDVAAIVVNYHDISERKRTETALRRTTELLAHGQAVANIGSWEWDINTDAVTWSEEQYRIFGVTPGPGPLAYTDFLARLHPDDRALVAGAISRALKTHTPFEIDHRIVRPDGNLRFLISRGGIISDRAGRPARLIGVAVDMTARKQAEETLRRVNERLEAVIQAAPLAIFALDLEGTVQTWNPAAERLFGWLAAEVMGKPLPIVPDDKQEEFRDTRDRVLKGELLGGVERVRIRKDGTPVSVNVFTAALHDAEGRVSGSLALIEDVTNVKHLERQVFLSQKLEAVGRLAGGVAHDFNNLLTAIIGSADLLRESLPIDHDGRLESDEIRTAALRAADLTHQLLAFSRQQVLETQVLSLNEVVLAMDKLLRRLIGEDISVRTVMAPDLGAVRADPSKLEQVVVNLAVNARDAMPRGGELTIETANVALDDTYAAKHVAIVPGPYVMLMVTDTGVGMDAQTQERVFEPFFTTKERGKGTGLGLATVYGIVKQSGGYVWIYSEVGRGTTFKIYLPRVDAPAEPLEAAPAPTGQLCGSETVLVVEDQEEVRRLIHKLLKARGYNVLVAANGTDAIRLAQEYCGRIQLLVTDVVMPGMSGREVGRTLGTSRPEMKVLYLSGYTDDSVVRHGVLQAGVEFLQKPFTADVLARKVRDVLDASA